MPRGTPSASNRSLQYVPLEALPIARPVDRIPYIAAACAGLRVLDFGAMDETAWNSKRGQGVWLHEEIARTASHVDGIDNSDLIPATGLVTSANSIIRRGDITDPQRLTAELPQVPDIVVAGEIIEHLENPLAFLRRLAQTPELSGKTLILSTPNATAIPNVLIGLARRESAHPDHLCIFSYKTLTTLCRRAGFADWEIVPYYSRFSEMQLRHSGLARVAIRAVQAAVNGLEWLFPLLSFGYIVRARI